MPLSTEDSRGPKRREEYRCKERQRWHSRKSTLKVKEVASLSDREHRKMRKYWRTTKAYYRKRQKEVTNLATPPLSPVHPLHEANQQEPLPPSKINVRMKKNKNKLMNKISKLSKELEQQKRETQRFKKRWQREKKKAPETPRKKTMKLLCHANAEILKKKFLVYHVIVDQITKRYKAQKKERQRRTVATMLAGSLVKKYRLQKFIQSELGLSRRNFTSTGRKSTRKKYASQGECFKQKIINFYTPDDNSRMAAGKKETKTKNKEKQQKRFLSDTIKNLHAKFRAENPSCKISYTLFSRLRPFG